ncbi:MAG TPA: aminotransferase class V-fold PLP-dependent enzyme, partial [Polymorphobacter sp.]|nr:aminotransferase class V-fold PLP-dependent enzyme [Polymorphobacter sp.]
MTTPVYLDYAATAPIDPAAVAAMTKAAARWANPSSVHSAGRAAHAALEDARESLARGLGCQPSAVVFTSG